MNKGLNEHLFHLLWQKDNDSHFISTVLIPDTVIYQYSMPRFWYFTSKSGIILKKSNQNLNEQSILTSFKKKISMSGIIAMLMYVIEGEYIVDYLNLERFEKFIKERKKTNQMILQKFVDPCGDYNACYTVVWTNNLTVFEKKENKQKLILQQETKHIKATQKEARNNEIKQKLISLINSGMNEDNEKLKSDTQAIDLRLKLLTTAKNQERSYLTKNESLTYKKKKTCKNQIEEYERAVTFDGKDYHVTTSPIFGSLLPSRLQSAADSISSHLSSVSPTKSQVASMTLHLKLDYKNRLSLICATALSFQDTFYLSSTTLRFTPSKETNFKNLTLSTRRPARFSKDHRCSSCLEMFESDKVLKFPYKEILKMYKGDPVLIYNLHPKIEDDEEVDNFQQLLKKRGFLGRELSMCFVCYTQFVEKNKGEMVLGLPKIKSRMEIREKEWGGRSLASPVSCTADEFECSSVRIAKAFDGNSAKRNRLFIW